MLCKVDNVTTVNKHNRDEFQALYSSIFLIKKAGKLLNFNEFVGMDWLVATVKPGVLAINDKHNGTHSS